jgi:hypothetical protein
MKGISVEEVLDACRGMLEQKNLPSAHGNQSATP